MAFEQMTNFPKYYCQNGWLAKADFTQKALTIIAINTDQGRII